VVSGAREEQSKLNRRSSGVQGLVFGGIMAALVLVFSLVPFLAVLVPLPLVLVYVRYGGRTATLTGLVATVLTMMFQGASITLFLTLPAGILPGLAFGYGFRHKLKPLVIGLIATLTFFGGYVANYVATRAAFMGGQDPIEELMAAQPVRERMDQLLATVQQTVEQQSATTEAQQQAKANSLAQLKEYREDPVGVMKVLLPSGLFLGGVLSAFVNFSLCRFMLRRFGYEVPERAPFSEFRLPNWATAVFVLTTFGGVYMNRTLVNAPWWVKTLANVVPMVSLVFALCGLAVAYGYLRINMKMTKPAAALTALIPAVLFSFNAPLLYSMLAVFDTIIDFRGLGHGIWKRPEPNPWEGE
jgi:uncharacterized protein YybS (DUF2232 family)